LVNKIKRILTWSKFKELLIELHPAELFYAQGRAPLSTPPIELRLTFGNKNRQYIFIDTGKDEYLRQTKIMIHKDRYGNFSLEEEDLKRFISLQTGRNDLKIRSFELMGGY
jgi:hypothetical protein